MPGFTDRFGGSTITAAQVAYREAELSVSLETQWPVYATQDNVLSRIMNLQALTPALEVIMPDARESAPGQDVFFYNSGELPFNIVSHDGTMLGVVSPGERWYYILTDSSTEGGLWVTTQFGVGVSNLDISNAAGPGLLALGAQLGIARLVSSVSGSRTIGANDRARIIVWTGGAGTLTLPATADFNRFELSFVNQGTGALVIQPSGGETIDGGANITLSIAESAEVHAGNGLWVTVGRGRSTQFNFTQLQKAVDGGADTLTLSEAANVVQTYVGTLVSNQVITLPAITQVYYVRNQTSGPFTLTFRNPGVGVTVPVPQGQNSILFSDGLNVVNATTSVAVVSGSAQFDAGSAGFTPVGLGAPNTGLFSSGPGVLGVSAGGVQVADFSVADGLRVVGTTPQLQLISSSGAARVRVSSPAGTSRGLDLLTAATLRWRLQSNSVVEAGANAGSNLELQRFDDAGGLLGTALTVDRQTGIVAVPLLTLGSNPIASDQGATKDYVDGVTPSALPASPTSYTLAVSDLGKIKTANSAGNNPVVLPKDTTAAIRVGGVIPLIALNTGVITITAEAGATVNYPATGGLSTERYRPVAALKIAANSWIVIGGRP